MDITTAHQWTVTHHTSDDGHRFTAGTTAVIHVDTGWHWSFDLAAQALADMLTARYGR